MSKVWVVCVVAALAEGFLHYFPWRLALGGRELPRPAAYVLGVLGFALPYAMWLWERGATAEMLALAAVLAAAGGAVVALYALDWALRAAWERKEALARERQLAQMVKHEQA